MKDHTCSLKIIHLNLRKGEMRLLFLENQKLNLNTPLKKQQQHKHGHVHVVLPGARNWPKGQTAVLDSLHIR